MIKHPPTLQLHWGTPSMDAMLHHGIRRASGHEQRQVARVGLEDPFGLASPRAREAREDNSTGSHCPPIAAPTQDERAVMAVHGIQFDGRGFRFAGYRYERLIDAVHQSRRWGQGCE